MVVSSLPDRKSSSKPVRIPPPWYRSIRIWEREQPAESKPQTARDYETVGLVLEGKAELHIEGQLVLLEKGDSWVVPKGSRHTYKVIETFTAVEATSPPAEVHGRDE